MNLRRRGGAQGDLSQDQKGSNMNKTIYWKSPVRTGAKGEPVYWQVDHGAEADMPTGAMTGEQDLPTTLEVEWKEIERPGAAGTVRGSKALSVLSPPVFGRRYGYRASAFLEVEELGRLATTAGDPSHLLALYLPRIRAGQIVTPAKGARRENFWWAVQDWIGHPTQAPRILERKWFRPILEIITEAHPKAADILAEWDRRVTTHNENPFGKKTAGCVVFSTEPIGFRNGAYLQVFEMQSRKLRTRTRIFPSSGIFVLSSGKSCLPVCDEALEHVGVSPAVGYAAVLSRHCVQMRAAPSAHARLQIDMQNAPLLEKWAERFENWRAALLSDDHVERDVSKMDPIERQIDAAINALLSFTDASRPPSVPTPGGAPALARRAQEVCDALFDLKEARARDIRPELVT
jgi:hypothetical protein